MLASKHLIVLATPDAANRGAGRIDWIRREIEVFENGPNAGNILLVRAKDGPGGALPGDLDLRYPNLEIIDLTGLGPFSFLNPAKATRLSDETAKLLAPLMGFGLDDMPALRREEERRQQTKLGLAAGSATAVVVAVAALAVFAFQSRNRALDALSRSLFATDRVIQSVSASLPDGEARSNVLASSCDLMDSLRDRASAAPRTNALVICAVQRAESRDRLGESDQAHGEIERAIRLAHDQFATSASPDDALAELVARKAALKRAMDGKPPGTERKALSDFIAASKGLTEAAAKDKDLPEFAARTLHIAAVSLGEKRTMEEALIAVDSAIEFGKVGIDRGAELAMRLDLVSAFALKAQLHSRKKDPQASTRAAARAKELFAKISVTEAEQQGLRDRFEQVASLVGAVVPRTAR